MPDKPAAPPWRKRCPLTAALKSRHYLQSENDSPAYFPDAQIMGDGECLSSFLIAGLFQITLYSSIKSSADSAMLAAAPRCREQEVTTKRARFGSPCQQPYRSFRFPGDREPVAVANLRRPAATKAQVQPSKISYGQKTRRAHLPYARTSLQAQVHDRSGALDPLLGPVCTHPYIYVSLPHMTRCHYLYAYAASHS